MATKIIFTVTDASGNPEEGATVDIQLPEAGINTLDDSATLTTSVKFKTNRFGKVDNEFGYIELEPVIGVEYVAVITGANKKRKGIYKFIVPPSEPTDDPIKWTDLVLSPPPSGISYDAAAIADITNERILAQQAAESVNITDKPKYKPLDLRFINAGGNYIFNLAPGSESAFFTVKEDSLPTTALGSVIVPEDSVINFDVGTSFVFIKDNELYQTVDISFGGATENVKIDALDAGGTKLQSRTDVITLIKVDDNTWKVFNLAAGGDGDGTGQANLFAVYTQLGTLESRVSILAGAQAGYVEALNDLQARTSDNDSSIAYLNNAVASITSVLATLNATIDRKITEAVPGLGDIQTYVDEAEEQANISITNAGIAANASTSAGQSALTATQKLDAIEIIEDNIEEVLGASNIIAKNLADLKLLPYTEIQSAFLEGVNAPNDPECTSKRYWYDPESLEPSDDEYVIRSDFIPAPTIEDPAPVGTPDDTYPGRWLHLPLCNDQFLDGSISAAKLQTGTVVGRANLDPETGLTPGGAPSILYRSLSGDDFDTNGIGDRNTPNRAITARTIRGSHPYRSQNASGQFAGIPNANYKGHIILGSIGNLDIGQGSLDYTHLKGSVNTIDRYGNYSSHLRQFSDARIISGGYRSLQAQTTARSNGGETRFEMLAGCCFAVNGDIHGNQALYDYVRWTENSDRDVGDGTAQRFIISSSPPWNMGHGDIGLFVNLEYNGDGTIYGAQFSDTPVWAYNGKTNIAPDKKEIVNGVVKNYKKVRTEQPPLHPKDGGSLKEYTDWLAKSEVKFVEIDHEMKNRDMVDIPHPFAKYQKGDEYVFLDPCCDFVDQLKIMMEHGEDIYSLFTDGYVEFDHVPDGMTTPKGVVAKRPKWKNTKSK
jgi:hypothetical protein